MMKKSFKSYGIIGATILLIAVFFSINTNTCFSADKDKSIKCYKEIAKTVVHATALGLGEILKDVKTADERIVLIRAFVSPIRFYPDNSGYFYGYDFKCVNIAHATQKDLQGKNLYDHKDVKGKYVIRELSAAAKKGGGFVEFYWVKPGTKGEKKKLGYVEPIPGTDYFIGTGVYLP
ncbi:MAG: C50 carotenoid epsilon cyclase [Deltaproteobacteria bacterium HGW-Deltaproteobacteria-2]|jgi:signal transduction histidine kinase|nr:MAG: C50 carotenoid epsilon cyclase [Deltaproteobacteria bacterium HGW-Deltaproteobacteria-2]